MTEPPKIALRCPHCHVVTDELLRIESVEKHTTYRYSEEFGWHNWVSGPDEIPGRPRWECPNCRREIEHPNRDLVELTYTIKPIGGRDEEALT